MIGESEFQARLELVEMRGERHFDVPIVVEDIDYLIIGGEHIVDVN